MKGRLMTVVFTLSALTAAFAPVAEAAGFRW